MPITREKITALVWPTAGATDRAGEAPGRSPSAEGPRLSAELVDAWTFAQMVPRVRRRGETGGEDPAGHVLTWSTAGLASPRGERFLEAFALASDIAGADPADTWLRAVAWHVCGPEVLYADALGLPLTETAGTEARVQFGGELLAGMQAREGATSEPPTPNPRGWNDWVALRRHLEAGAPGVTARDAVYDDLVAAEAEAVLVEFEARTGLPPRLARPMVTSFWPEAYLEAGGYSRPGGVQRLLARQTLVAALTSNPAHGLARVARDAVRGRRGPGPDGRAASAATAGQGACPAHDPALEVRGIPRDERSGRRWIRARLDQLDPERDHAEIVRLSSVFVHAGVIGDLFGDWVACQSMPRFATTPSAPAIYRGGSGKLMCSNARRLHDTGSHALIWADFGPEAPSTRHSISMINALHAKYIAEYPAAFDDDELWLYVLAWEICGVDYLLSRTLGAPEPDDKVKRAKVVSARGILEQVLDNRGEKLTELATDIETYEDWVALLDRYESRSWAYSHEAAQCAQASLALFERRFPRPLAPLARALVTSFWYDGMFTGNGITPPGQLARTFATGLMGLVLMTFAVRGDPKESWSERHLRRARVGQAAAPPVLRVVTGRRVRSGRSAS